MDQWQDLALKIDNITDEVTIAVVGKYIQLQDAYKSIYEALRHSAWANNVHMNLRKISAEEVTAELCEQLLGDVDGVLVPGGFGPRAVEGKVHTASYTRREGIPYFGICLGMQCAVIDYARNVLGMETANSTEFDEEAHPKVIYKLRDLIGVEALGGTMRLGKYPCDLTEGSRAREAYDAESTDERHRHRYEVNLEYVDQLQDAGLKVTGRSPDGKFIEIVELEDHPWFLGCQFHPEYRSKPTAPHPLFSAFAKAMRAHKDSRKSVEVATAESELPQTV